MAPAEPPDPMPWNRPFQASAGGSHTSNRISEPASGRDVPATRQNDTSSTVKPRDEKVSGGVNGGVTASATVMVVCGRPSGASAMRAHAPAARVGRVAGAPPAASGWLAPASTAAVTAASKAQRNRLGVCAAERCRLLAGLVGRQAEPQATLSGLVMGPQGYRTRGRAATARGVPRRRHPALPLIRPATPGRARGAGRAGPSLEPRFRALVPRRRRRPSHGRDSARCVASPAAGPHRPQTPGECVAPAAAGPSLRPRHQESVWRRRRPAFIRPRRADRPPRRSFPR